MLTGLLCDKVFLYCLFYGCKLHGFTPNRLTEKGLLVSQGKRFGLVSLPPLSFFSGEASRNAILPFVVYTKTPKSSFCWKHKLMTKSLRPFLYRFCLFATSVAPVTALRAESCGLNCTEPDLPEGEAFLFPYRADSDPEFRPSSLALRFLPLGNINHCQQAMLPSPGSVCVCVLTFCA